MKKPQPLKGQKSIASFVFAKPKQDSSDQPAEVGTHDDTDAQMADDHEEQPRKKRPKHEKAATVPSAPQQVQPPAAPQPTAHKPPPPNAVSSKLTKAQLATRHDRWQAKLVSDADQSTRRHTEQIYDPRQPIPASVKLTPLEQQVVALQKAHPDLLLVIECGYKFRFYGADAEKASSILGLFAYPDHHFLSTWVPVPRLHHHIRRIVHAGHRVGVVRQIETAAIKATSNNKNKPFERKLVNTYSRATLEAGELGTMYDDALARVVSSNGDDNDDQGPHSSAAVITPPITASWSSEQQTSYLVCVVEQKTKQNPAAEIGIVAVETSTGSVLYSQFTDGILRNTLESLLLYALPAELLMTTPVSASTRRMLQSFAAQGVMIEEIDRGTGYQHGGALAALTDFYSNTSSSQPKEEENEDAVRAVMQLPTLVVEALVYATEYLEPYGLTSVLKQAPQFKEYSQANEMSLGPNALRSLEILRNSDDGDDHHGAEYGTLLWLMDRTLTQPGSRMMRHWVSHPLRERSAILARLDAVEEMIAKNDIHPTLSALPAVLKGLPDLERSVTRVLHGTSSTKEFIQLLKVFVELHSKLHLYPSSDDNGTTISLDGIESVLLKQTLRATVADLKCAAVARDTIKILNEDSALAGDKTTLFLDDDRFAEYAQRRDAVSAAVAALESLRPQLASAINIKTVQYVSLQGQGDYLVEIAPELVSRVPADWVKISTTKKAVRFRPPAVKQALQELDVAKEYLVAASNAAWKQLLREFAEHHAIFAGAVRAIATLDCLNSLASLASTSSRGYVRPRFVEDDDCPQLHIVNGRHPVLDVVLDASFVANDTHLQGDLYERCAVITGPNMGGKSCYIRQAALIAIMAQIGSCVPAESVTLRAFDGVYTRMGAADSIALGRSTFLEELSECSLILNNATPSSLVIIDELGRGTSTHDGTAIAAAVLQHAVKTTQCLTLFVTHYLDVLPMVLQSADGSSLGDSIKGFHMAYELESNTTGIPQVVFLYRLAEGLSEASFGLNVARMAHLPSGVIQRASEKAIEFEGSGNKVVTGVEEELVNKVLTVLNSGSSLLEDHGMAALQQLQHEIVERL